MGAARTCGAGSECCQWRPQDQKRECVAGCFPPKTRAGARANKAANCLENSVQECSERAATRMSPWSRQGQRMKDGMEMGEAVE